MFGFLLFLLTALVAVTALVMNTGNILEKYLPPRYRAVVFLWYAMLCITVGMLVSVTFFDFCPPQLCQTAIDTLLVISLIVLLWFSKWKWRAVLLVSLAAIAAGWSCLELENGSWFYVAGCVGLSLCSCSCAGTFSRRN